MSVNVANLFDRNPLHVAHLQGPVDRLPDANLRPVYERAGKILLIQRWKEPKSGESHAFLLFETEQAAMACCSRIGALRVTSDRQNSRPITVSALSCANATSNAVLNQWLHSQHMVPSYVMKNPPPAPPSASFPLACLTPLTENCGLVVQMLREHKCALSWWRFVAQMYVANKMWTPAQFILGHSTKSEEGTDVQTVKGKDKDKENQAIEINTTVEDIIDISDDSVGENMSESEDDQNPDFARAQKLQKEAMAPTQPKAPPTGPRRFGNAWLPHKRPNVQNARAKLGIVPVKPAAKSSTAAEKSVEKSAAPTLVQAPTPAQAQIPATVSAPPVPTPASGLAVTEPVAKSEPTPAVPKDAESGEPSNPTAESPAPPSTPAPSSAPAPPEISPPFVPTPMSASPEVTRPHPSASPSLPSTPTPAPAPVNNSSLPRPPPTLPPPPTALAALPTPPKTSASTPTRPASQTSSRAPSQTPSRQASQAPARPSTTSPASASKPVLNPPSSPSLPVPPSRGSTSPSRPPPRGPSLASLIRPKTTELGLAKIPQNAEAFQVQQRVQANMVVPDATGTSASAVAAAAVTGSSTSANTTATTGVLPALPAGMPQRPSWIPTGSANTSGTQESGPSASSSPSKPTNSMPAPAVPATVVEKADDIPSVEMAPPEAAIESPNLDEVRTADHTDRQMSDVEDLRPTNPEDQHPTRPEGQQPTIEPEDQRPKELIDQRGPPRSTPKKRSRWFLSDDKEETPSSSSPGLVVRTESLSSVDALVVEPESLVVEPEPHLFGSSLTSPVISSSLTSPHSTPAKRKSELDTRGFEARLKKRRHRESRSDTESAQANSSVPDLPAYGSGPTLPDSVFGVSLPGVESSLTATLAVIPPETYGRTSEEPSTPKSAFRTRLVDSSAQRPRRSRSPLPVRIERPVASGTRTAEEASLENELRLARRTSLSDMDPRTWKATLDENEALKMKIRVLELTLPTAESVKSELHAERKEKTQLIESLEIERSLLVQSEALRKHSDTTRKELETRISQLEDRLSDSASALEHARESAHVAAEQRRRAEEASRIADSERSKVGVLLDAERALVNTERAALAKEREGRAEVEAKCAGVEARLAAEQRRYAEASEVARKELSEAKDFLDAEKALSGAQEAMLAHERELKDEVEAKLDEAEARAAQYAEEKKAAETKLDKELERAGKLLNAERALVAKERMTIAEERDTRSKLDKQLKAAQYQAASHKDRMAKADGLLTVVTEQLAKSNEQLAAANAKVVEVENQLGLSVKAVVAARAQVTSLEEQLSTANGSLATTTELLTKAQGELTTNITQLATANEQLTVTTIQLAAMKEQLSATEQREQGIKVNLLSWHRQLAIARDQTAAMERRTRLAEEKAATMELAQQSRTTDLARLKQVLESEQEVLMMERATLARERLLRKETEKKLVSAEERLVALDKHASDTRLQMQENRSTNDGSSEQMQTQRTLMHMARMRIQELEQAVQRIEADLDASRSAEATAKTMIQLGWGSMRPRLESSPMSDMDPEFPDVRPDAMDEDSETGNPFMSLMKPPRQQSFKLKRTAVPARLLKVDMPSGECVNIDLGGLPSNAGAVVDLLHKSKCAGVFWDIIMDEYGAMGCFEAAEAIAVGKLKYQP